MRLALPISLSLLWLGLVAVPASAQITRNYDIKDFNKLKIGSNFKVVLYEGTTPGLEMTGMEEDLQEIEIKNDGSTLIVRREHNWRFRDLFNEDKHTIQVKLTYTHLESIKASGASSVRAEHILEGNHLSLEVSGASDLDVEVDVRELICSSSGASDLKLFGQAGQVTINCSGASDVKANSFRAHSADIDCSGASTIHIGVDELLDANASGASDIYVYGSPRVQQSRSSGASDIHFREKNSK